MARSKMDESRPESPQKLNWEDAVGILNERQHGGHSSWHRRTIWIASGPNTGPLQGELIHIQRAIAIAGSYGRKIPATARPCKPTGGSA